MFTFVISLVSVGIRSSTERTPSLKECSAHVVVCQFFQDEKPRKAFHLGDAAFEDLK